VPAKDNWGARKKLLLGKVYNNLDTLLAEAKDKDVQRRTSLAVFRPTQILGFTYRRCEREWGNDRVSALRQGNLFEEHDGKYEVIKKLPYQFSYRFSDCRGRKSKLMIQDWELGHYFWQVLEKSGGDERRACEAVKHHYFDKLTTENDLYFVLGTMLEFQAKNAPNPFIIAGVFAPPKERQLRFANF
ncbi:MAG TPA: hypothetical protein PLP17_07925, partial [Oligoflexia bacterium]|nr:hypothetical protein [Oligoflexia bacterium]